MEKLRTSSLFLVLAALAAGCGSVTPELATAREEGGTSGAAGDVGTPAAGAGGGAAGTGAAGTAPADAGAEAACAPPALEVSWAISDLATGVATTCAAAGVSDLRLTISSPSGSFAPISFALPCAPGKGQASLAGVAGGFLYDLSAEGPGFGEARAAWVPSTGGRVGTVDRSRCGADAAGAADASPFRVVAGAPPSCAPCAEADRCPAWGTAGTCEGRYGPARADAIATCQSYAGMVCP